MLLVLLSLSLQVFAAPADVARSVQGPTVVINSPEATLIGLPPSFLAPNTEEFLGVPYALPPTGDRRLKPPEPITEPMGTVSAQENGNVCPQFVFSNNLEGSLPTAVIELLAETPLVQNITSQSEDCLVMSINRPTGTKEGDNLPVLFWIYGGGFELGWNSMYPGSIWVEESVKQGQPIIVVTVNYRVGGYGFLGGKELTAEGSTNLGLLDQRLCLQWVADNIAKFGGDPEKVTIWGESAGSISVFYHMLAYDGNNLYKGKPLFRGGIMNSGTAVPSDWMNSSKPQAVYDRVVEVGGCSNAEDTVACLRGLPYDSFNHAVNSVPGILSYSSIALSYLPRPDGMFLTASPDVLGYEGKIAKVPFIVGDMEDEGTLFALFESNITTKEEIVDYLHELVFANPSRDVLAELVDIYNDSDEYASPFRTGSANNWYPQFKRLAAILGDLVFTITRRGMLKFVADLQTGIPFWSYLNSYYYGTPILGSGHGLDIISVFYGLAPGYATTAWRQYYINFVNNLDPNKGVTANGLAFWPQWTENQTIIQMHPNGSQYITDDFRQPVLDFLLKNVTQFYF
ncbi:uncharacterized protein PV09_04327 [Verruconis gallopava]|uniref:Carboxylic ester hydrolase n=1 Tax=Verruconis gallopava TaxID=253628 RepID=A0A0D1YV94_9PEZI|nr:uncharacterized protein PV09_04327 [Verruconis gallopava]KIW04577.1 hypothetical protein PV09_04327 [Verruconis gallopava]